MGKQLVSPLTEMELVTLEEMGRHHPYPDFRFRARGIISLNAGHRPGIIGQVLGVSEQSVYNWARWWKQYGLAGLLDGHKGGRPEKLTEELVESAVNIAAAEPLTLAGIRQRVQARHPNAPDFSLHRLSVRLKERKFSFKRCRLSLKKKRPEQEYAEKEADLKLLKEAAMAQRIHLYFSDESGMATVPNVQRAWSPLSKPHCADASVPYKRVNIIGALDYAANELIYSLQEETVKRPDVVTFIDQLAARHDDGKLTFVVLDNASIHRHIDVEKTGTWMADHQLILFPLPPYSPELNPIEILWKHAKYHWRKFSSWTKEEVIPKVNEILRGYGKKFKISFT